MTNIINAAICCNKIVKVNPKSSHHRKKNFLYSFDAFIYVGQWCSPFGNHFMMHVSRIIMLYTLNLYSAVIQLHLNKTGRK